MNNKGKNIGYKRVSTVDQNTARQLDGLELDEIFEDKVSGKNVDRPALRDMLKYVRAGDYIYVHSMDRLARNTTDLISIVNDLSDKGISIKFIKEGLNFEKGYDAASKLMLTVLGAIAEFERSTILERQREGIAIAKKKGAFKNVGRKKSISDDKVQKLFSLYEKGAKVADIARELEVSRPTIYKTLRENNQCANQIMDF